MVKLKFERLYLSCHRMIIALFNIIRKHVYSSLEWYHICYDFAAVELAVPQNKGEVKSENL